MAKGITLQEIDSLTNNRLVIKDSAGRAKVTAPSAADDIALKSTVDNAVGTLSSLLTTDKSNVVKAINELFTNVSNGKTSIAAAITGKGVSSSGSETFSQLATKIGQIAMGSKVAKGRAGVSINNIDTDSGSTFKLANSLVIDLNFVPSKIITKISAIADYYDLRYTYAYIDGVRWGNNQGSSYLREMSLLLSGSTVTITNIPWFAAFHQNANTTIGATVDWVAIE